MSTDAVSDANLAREDAPTAELVTGVVGDRCPNCQSPMAADQRYCLNCGERRGRARFSPNPVGAQTAPAAGTTETTVVSRHPRSRFSAGSTLVAGVATLLIALGVGVLIGHNSNSGSGRAPAAQVITVGGGGAGAASTTAATPAQKASNAKAAAKAKRTVVHVTAKTAKAATAAASKVLGSATNLSKNVTQGINKPCTGGAGCQNGKFTGNFFPGG